MDYNNNIGAAKYSEKAGVVYVPTQGQPITNRSPGQTLDYSTKETKNEGLLLFISPRQDNTVVTVVHNLLNSARRSLFMMVDKRRGVLDQRGR